MKEFFKKNAIIIVVVLLTGIGLYFIFRRKDGGGSGGNNDEDKPDIPIWQLQPDFDWSKKHSLLANKDQVRVWNENKSAVMKVAKKNEWLGIVMEEPKDGWFTAYNSVGNKVKVATEEAKIVY